MLDRLGDSSDLRQGFQQLVERLTTELDLLAEITTRNSLRSCCGDDVEQPVALGQVFGRSGVAMSHPSLEIENVHVDIYSSSSVKSRSQPHRKKFSDFSVRT